MKTKRQALPLWILLVPILALVALPLLAAAGGTRSYDTDADGKNDLSVVLTDTDGDHKVDKIHFDTNNNGKVDEGELVITGVTSDPPLKITNKAKLWEATVLAGKKTYEILAQDFNSDGNTAGEGEFVY